MNASSAKKDFLSTQEAVELLSIRKETLYAYVSRGLVRNMVGGKTNRSRLYLKEDLLRLQTRSRVRSGHAAVAASAMNLGDPIVPTGITDITPQGPQYRGRLAIDLAQQLVDFEQVAELLWTGLWHPDSIRWRTTEVAARPPLFLKSVKALDAQTQLIELFSVATLSQSFGRGALEDRLLAGHTLDAARQIFLTLVGCFGYIGPTRRYKAPSSRWNLAGNLLRAMGKTVAPEQLQLLNQALILLADHELSPGTLSARVAASSGSSLHSCLSAAMATSSGTEVAQVYGRIDAFLTAHGTQQRLISRTRHLLDNGLQVPGFEHPLYPQGDPRALFLLEQLRHSPSISCETKNVIRWIDFVQSQKGVHARHELALVVTCRSMGLAPQAPAAIFVLSRVAGWVAHILEQRLSGTLLRPRAKFIASSPAMG
jgi:citrate synthase